MTDTAPTPRGTATRAEILADISSIAYDELDYEGVVLSDHRLVEDLELDSIRLLTLATAVEDHFRIRLDEDDESSMVTVADLLDLIEAKQAAAAGDGVDS